MKRARKRGLQAILGAIMGFPWTSRIIKLDPQRRKLSYWDGDVRKDEIDIRLGVVCRVVEPQCADGRSHAFGLYDSSDKEVLLMAAADASEMQRWVMSLNRVSQLESSN
jgi:hypothetical protein